MKTHKSLILLAGAALLLAGCFKAPDIPVNEGPYIQMYYTGAINCEQVFLQESTTGPMLAFMVAGTEDEEFTAIGYGSTGDKKAFYDSLSNKHFDYGYNGEDIYANELAKRCYSKDLTSISVVCDKDFDDEHPAGTPLDDIIAYDAYSPYPWIKEGYKGDPTFTHCLKYVKDLEPDDMKLLGCYNLFNLYFMTYPRYFTQLVFTITVATDDGMTYEIGKEVHF